MIPDEAVEAAARAHYDSSPTHRATWVQLSVGHKRELMTPIRAALEAAAPHLMAAAWAEGYMRGQFPWTKVGPFVDPIPEWFAPAETGRNANPYRAK